MKIIVYKERDYYSLEKIVCIDFSPKCIVKFFKIRSVIYQWRLTQISTLSSSSRESDLASKYVIQYRYAVSLQMYVYRHNIEFTERYCMICMIHVWAMQTETYTRRKEI